MRIKVIKKSSFSFGKKQKAKSTLEHIFWHTTWIIFQKGKDFCKILDLKLSNFRGNGVVWIESIISLMNAGISEFQHKISNSVADYKKYCKDAFYHRTKFYDLIALKDISELQEPDQLEDLSSEKVTFKEVDSTIEYMPDAIGITGYDVVHESSFKDVKFNQEINQDIDRIGLEKSKDFRKNFKHLKQPSFPKAVIPFIPAPITVNILDYFKSISLPTYLISALIGLLVEGVIWYITGTNVMQLDDSFAMIVAFGPMVFVFALVVVFFNTIEQYARSSVSIPFTLKFLTTLAVLVVLCFGVLSAFHTDKKAELKNQEMLIGQLTQKQQALFVAPDNQTLIDEVANLNAKIKAMDSQKEPFLIEILRYIGLSLFGVSLLFCSMVLKIMLMLAFKVVLYKRAMELADYKAEQIKLQYDNWCADLKSGYLLRNEIIHLICKKHACSELISNNPQDKDYNL